MTDFTPARSQNQPAVIHATGGLRLRLWLACLGGALVAAGGIWWVIGTQLAPRPQLDLSLVVSWLGAVAGLGVVVGAAFALWLDHGVVAHTRGLAQAISTRQIARLRGLPAASGWGELSLLTQQIQLVVTQYRSAERAADDLGLVRDQLDALHESLERWNDTERWSVLKIESGPVGPVIDAINRGVRRLDELRDQNLEATRQISRELEGALEAARETSEQAERAFLESTALLTTVRELQRLESELQQSLAGDAAAVGQAPLPSEGMAAAREAIEELVTGSAEAVEGLARGLRRIEGIAEQVSLLANRATVIALDSAIGSRGSPEGEDERDEQTRRLMAEIREAVDRTVVLKRELEAEVSDASQRMREVRVQVAQKLERVPSSVGPARPPQDAERMLDRVREMIQDATRKGERLSAAGERASRAAESLLRTLESESRELEGLKVRLSPIAPEPGALGHATHERPSPAGGTGLRLLGENDLLANPDRPLRAPGTGEDPR